MILVTWLGAVVIQAVAKAYILPVLFLISDAVLAMGLLLLAVRYSSWWMGAAMLLQATGLSLHAAYFAAEKSDLNRHVLWLYIAGKNGASFAMLLVILAAGLAAWRRRSRRARPARASRPAEQDAPITARAA